MDYYRRHLSGERLRECYEIAPPRVKQYLEAEIRHALGHLRPGDRVLELGCGYGRVALRLATVADRVLGIDTSPESVALARVLGASVSNLEYLEMDALELAFPEGSFDAVVCVQNGICAFGVDQDRLVREAVRVARVGGHVLFSSYSPQFWRHRLRWFELQAERGLVGEIDPGATGNGVIVCKDGLRLSAMPPEGFKYLCESAGLACSITEVDGSSLFCEIDGSRRGPESKKTNGSSPWRAKIER
jgi:2-polyprenyl-6-hydroxyphenyl methylase/3-demethylubiquinone-9 3-methyltransferase